METELQTWETASWNGCWGWAGKALFLESHHSLTLPDGFLSSWRVSGLYFPWVNFHLGCRIKGCFSHVESWELVRNTARSYSWRRGIFTGNNLPQPRRRVKSVSIEVVISQSALQVRRTGLPRGEELQKWQRMCAQRKRIIAASIYWGPLSQQVLSTRE